MLHIAGSTVDVLLYFAIRNVYRLKYSVMCRLCGVTVRRQTGVCVHTSLTPSQSTNEQKPYESFLRPCGSIT